MSVTLAAGTCPNCLHDECRIEDRFCVKCGRRLSVSRSEEHDALGPTKPDLDPARVYVRLGVLKRARGHAAEAVRWFTKALQHDSSCEAARQALAEMHTDPEADVVSAAGTDH